MSQSPLDATRSEAVQPYLDGWDALALRIRRGQSLSGRERNCCFLNTRGPRFADVSAATGLDLADDGRGLALVDWDQDGDLDLWLANRTGPSVRMMRNDSGAGNHFLAVRLQGTTSNRDAIGARVELHLKRNGMPAPVSDESVTAGSAEPSTDPLANRYALIKTLRAGDGFASQSSKWIHFGLGPAADVDRLVVHWPGGNTETFTGLDTDRRYQIVQGSGRAEPIAARPSIQLVPSTATVPASTARARIVLTQRPELPPFTVQRFDQTQLTFDEHSAGPLLINLWASWCQPCLTELNDLASHESQLRERGLRVIALCTDQLTQQGASDDSAARGFVDRTAFPFETGMAPAELLRRLTELHHQAIYRQLPLPLPTSFLVDSNGRVAVIYKGPITSEQLLSDISLLDADAAEVIRAAFPFPGRSVLRLFGIDPVSIARAYFDGEYDEDAKAELRKVVDQIGQVPEGDLDAVRRRQITGAYRLLANIARRNGKPDEELDALRQLVRLQPGRPAPRIELATALWQQNRRADAGRYFADALRLSPDDPATSVLLGQAEMQIGRADEALVHFRRAYRLSPDNIQVRLNLAMARQLRGETAEAVEHYRWILTKQPELHEAMNNLAWLYATHPNPRYRNAEGAVELARRLCESTQFQLPQYLDTLAAAYAENGSFSEAGDIAVTAIRLAHGRGEFVLAKTIEERLAIYRAGKPFRDEPRPRT